jgi:hypothetical protein
MDSQIRGGLRAFASGAILVSVIVLLTTDDNWFMLIYLIVNLLILTYTFIKKDNGREKET